MGKRKSPAVYVPTGAARYSIVIDWTGHGLHEPRHRHELVTGPFDRKEADEIADRVRAECGPRSVQVMGVDDAARVYRDRKKKEVGGGVQ